MSSARKHERITKKINEIFKNRALRTSTNIYTTTVTFEQAQTIELLFPIFKNFVNPDFRYASCLGDIGTSNLLQEINCDKRQ